MGSSKPVNGILQRIRWEDPPAPRGKKNPGRKGYEKHIETLRKNPGRWGIIASNVTEPLINSSKLRKRFPDIEFVWRENPNGKGVKGKGRIYARCTVVESAGSIPIPEASEAPKLTPEVRAMLNGLVGSQSTK